MLLKKIKEVEAVDVEMDGVKDVKVRVLFGPADGAPTFAMRVFEMAPGGHTPYHEHPFEHEAVILEGEIAMVTKDGKSPVGFGDVIMVEPGEVHQFKNLSDTKGASFMCLVPVEYQK